MDNRKQHNDAAKHIAIVEDDPGMRDLLCEYLSGNDYRVTGLGDSGALQMLLTQQKADLLILDLMLPGEDGLSVLRRLRQKFGVPVIIVSARGEEIDRVVGLEMGADDYLAKPFAARELLARVRAVLRRTNAEKAETNDIFKTFGPFCLHLNTHRLTQNNCEIALTNGEYHLLRVLLAHPYQVLSRDQLIGLLKGYERSPYDRSIDIRVTRLRRKIEQRPEKPVYIRTVWGEGYLFSPDGEETP